MSMNVSERLVYNWLINEKKYKANEIRYQRGTSPDFMCEDGKGYEAKRLNGNSITFSPPQIDNLKKNNSIIVVTDNVKEQIVKVFPYAYIKKITFPRIYISGAIRTIKINPKVWKKAKIYAIKHDITVSGLVEKLLIKEVKKNG